MVAVAQLVERRVVVPDVEGSSPFGHPKPPNRKIAAGYGVALGAGEAAAGGV